MTITASVPIAPSAKHGQQGQSTLRSQLYHLLPLTRHSLFQVHLHIHQLTNVPWLRGQFYVQWKFQNVHSAPATAKDPANSGFFNKGAKQPKRSPSAASKRSGNKHSTTTASSSTKGKERDDTSSVDGDAESGTNISIVVPSHVMSSNHSVHSSSSATSSTPDSPLFSGNAPVELKAESRGRTQNATLSDHKIKWDATVDVAVQMNVHRETMDLLPCELRLVVMQHVSPNDPDALHDPRLGALYLNLAEYANLGPIERRYLLRESKTNATLQLTIEITQIGGETVYKPPPLNNKGVFAGMTSLLQSSQSQSHHHPRAPALAWSQSGSMLSDISAPSSDVMSMLPPGLGPLFGGGGGGVATTDNLIEAIFNPVPSSSTTPSPFTYYEPSARNVSKYKGDGTGGGESGLGAKPRPGRIDTTLNRTTSDSTDPGRDSVSTTSASTRTSTSDDSEPRARYGIQSRFDAASTSVPLAPSLAISVSKCRSKPKAPSSATSEKYPIGVDVPHPTTSAQSKWWKRLGSGGSGSGGSGVLTVPNGGPDSLGSSRPASPAPARIQVPKLMVTSSTSSERSVSVASRRR